MYKTLNTVTVKVIGINNPIFFADSTETPGVGTAALNQILNEQDVEGYRISQGHHFNIIIPYHAIEYATVETTRSESEYEDDTQKNCTESGGATEEQEP